MNREEAIEILEEVKMYQYNQTYMDALDMAIEALKDGEKEKVCSNCQEFDCYGCKWAERKEG